MAMKRRRVDDGAPARPSAPVSAFAAAKARLQAIEKPSRTPLKEDGTETTSNEIVTTSARKSPELEKAPESVLIQSDESDQFSQDEELPLEDSGSVVPGVPVKQLSTVSAQAIRRSDLPVPGSFSVDLETGKFITFVGIYDLTVSKGIVSVNRALLAADGKSYRIYASTTHSPPTITAVNDAAVQVCPSAGTSIHALAEPSPLWARIWDSSMTSSSQGPRPDLQPVSDNMMSRNLAPLDVSTPARKVLGEILARYDDPACISAAVAIIGPKGSGKSTFARMLANTLLTARAPRGATPSCLWLDLDPGQPEFSAPGTVSLCQLRGPILGPPFTHSFAHPATSCRSVRSHTLGSLSPQENVQHYLACAADLYAHCRAMQAKNPRTPVVINCSGWTVGSGASVLAELLTTIIRADDIVLLQSAETDTLNQICPTSSDKTRGWTIAPTEHPPQTRTSAELRAMQAMSYFHSSTPLDGQPTWDTRPLSAMPKWTVSYRLPLRDGYDGEDNHEADDDDDNNDDDTDDASDPIISAILSYHDFVPGSQLWTVLEGLQVAIVAVDIDNYRHGPLPLFDPPSTTSNRQTSDDHSNNPVTRIQRTSPGYLPYYTNPLNQSKQPILDPRYSQCLGMALVRGIETKRQELDLLTPVPISKIRSLVAQGQKIVLVRGKFDCPDWAFLEDVRVDEQRSERKGGVTSKKSGKKADAGDEKRWGGRGPLPSYVGVRREDAGLSAGVWRSRHLPRNR